MANYYELTITSEHKEKIDELQERITFLEGKKK